MAGEITETKANVRPLAGAMIRRGTAGDTITAGQPVYLDGANGWKPTDGSDSDDCDVRGIMVAPQDAVSGNEIDICHLGPVTGYAGMTPGGILYISDTAGDIATSAGSNTKIVGWAESAQILFVQCSPDGDP